MKKENLIILIVITFIVGFVVGAVSGIKFYAREHGAPAAEPQANTAQQDAPAVNPEEINRLEQALKGDPLNLKVLIDLGNLYFDSKQPTKAIDAYKRALAIDPKNPDVLTDLGIMYRATKAFDKALKAFKEAARISTTHRNSRFNVAIVLEYDLKDINGAIPAWEDFLKVEGDGQRAAMAKAQVEQLKQMAK